MPHNCINTIYQFIKHFLDNKMSFYVEYGTFNKSSVYVEMSGLY